MEVLLPDYSRRFMAARQGFHLFVVKNRALLPGIVDRNQGVTDFNYFPELVPPKEFNSLTEVEREYDYLANHLPVDELDHDVLNGKIQADITLAEEFQQHKKFEKFVLSTAGFLPKAIPQDIVDDKLLDFDDLLWDTDKINYDFSPDSLDIFTKKYILPDSSEIRRYILIGINQARVIAGQFVDLPALQIKPTFIEDQPNSPWTGAVTTDEQGNLTVSFNLHPDRHYTALSAVLLGRHEGTHFFKALMDKQAIANRQISATIGLTAMASPETTILETLPVYAEGKLDQPNGIDSHGLVVQGLYEEVKEMIYHNAHVWINSGVDEAKILKYAKRSLRFEPPDRVESRIIAGRDLPTYRAVYGTYYYVRQLLAPLVSSPESDETKQTMSTLFSDSLIVSQLEQLIQKSVLPLHEA